MRTLAQIIFNPFFSVMEMDQVKMSNEYLNRECAKLNRQILMLANTLHYVAGEAHDAGYHPNTRKETAEETFKNIGNASGRACAQLRLGYGEEPA